jgi:AhpD family alkylhydroperoxidase
MQSRMPHPIALLPELLPALQALHRAAHVETVPHITIALVELRASQINGCSVCVDLHAADLKRSGDTDRRIFAVGAWREAPWFNPAERAALALAEYVTRLADKSDPVPDEVWNEARAHYSETELSSILMAIAGVNVWNRLNAATRQVAGAWNG